jgi:ethanolamine utilization protein EutM
MVAVQAPPTEVLTAVGVIEAEGFVAVVDAAEAMAKAADITVTGMLSIGSGIMAISISGLLADVVEAIEIGRSVIDTGNGVPVSAVVFANPAPAVRAIALHLDEVE